MRRTPDQLDDDRLLRDSARGFLEGSCAWSAPPRDRAALDAVRREIATLGWFATGLPERLGGVDADAVQSLLAIEEAGRVLLPFSLAADMVVAPRLMRREDGPIARLAPLLASGEARFALVGEDPRSDGLGFERGATGGRVTGRSGLALDLAAATHWLLTVGSRSPNGAAVLCVEAGSADLHEMRLFDGRSAGTLAFTGGDLPGVTILATGHEALDLTAELNDLAAAAAVADAYGALASGLALTVAYLNQRRQFGQTLGSLQAVQHLMADAFCDVESLRSLLLWAAVAIDRAPADRSRSIASAKVALGREGLRAASRMIQVSGGIAMTEEYRIGHVYKRLQVSAALHGATDARITQLAAETLPRTGRSDDEARAA